MSLRAFEKKLEPLLSKKKGDLKARLDSLAYRFTLFLPIFDHNGEDVFTPEHGGKIAKLFLNRCLGFSRTAVESCPPWIGYWLPPSGRQATMDRHMVFAVYTSQTPDADKFFRNLKYILELKEVAAQEIILIEKVAVELIAAEAS